jgi:alkylated DNA repair dioxygenase AlkB
MNECYLPTLPNPVAKYLRESEDVNQPFSDECTICTLAGAYHVCRKCRDVIHPLPPCAAASNYHKFSFGNQPVCSACFKDKPKINPGNKRLTDFLTYNPQLFTSNSCKSIEEKILHEFSPQNTESTNRSVITVGDPGITYEYSGSGDVVVHPWPEWLDFVRNIIGKTCNTRFNLVLINYYATGDQFIPFHKDNESCLSRREPVASLSLGEGRIMTFQESYWGTPKHYTMLLAEGSLLVMQPGVNRSFRHMVGKGQKMRMNLTFRVIDQGPQIPCDDKIEYIENEPMPCEVDQPMRKFTEELPGFLTSINMEGVQE